MADNDELTYSVQGMSCGHCVAAVIEAVEKVSGVESVDIALETTLVTTRGTGIDDAAVRAAVVQAGYEVAP